MRSFSQIFLRRKRRWVAKGLVRDSKKRIRYLFFLLGTIILVHTFTMVLLEELSFGDALWLSFTTINTTGYGDVSSSTLLGRTATVILMYVVGITLMAQVVSEFIEYKIEKKDQKIRGL